MVGSTFASAADTPAGVGATNRASLFCTRPTFRLFARAKLNSTYPIAPAVRLTITAVPAFAFAPSPTGQSDPAGCIFHAGLARLKNSFQRTVVPVDSWWYTTVIGRSGRWTDGLLAFRAASFHRVIFPR